jgi:hypothetical protein
MDMSNSVCIILIIFFQKLVVKTLSRSETIESGGPCNLTIVSRNFLAID